MKFGILICIFVLFFNEPLWASKINIDFGYYTMKAESPSVAGTSVSVNSLGSYSLSGNIPLAGNWELGLGYTVFFSKIYKGDMGFGPDFSIFYFPFNAGSGFEHMDRNVVYSEIEYLRPFAGLSFHQRQFQSIQSSYSGFGIAIGLEYQILRETAVRAQIKNQNLQGPSNTVMKWMELMVGLQQQF